MCTFISTTRTAGLLCIRWPLQSLNSFRKSVSSAAAVNPESQSLRTARFLSSTHCTSIAAEVLTSLQGRDMGGANPKLCSPGRGEMGWHQHRDSHTLKVTRIAS